MDSLSDHIKNIYICLVLSTTVAVIAATSTAIISSSVSHINIISAVGNTIFFLLLLLIHDNCDTIFDWRISILLGFAGFSGIGAAQLFQDAFKEKPTLLLSTLVDATQVFICLSAFALISEKNRWMFVGMPLMCILYTVLIISYANSSDASYSVSKALIYLSLFTVCGLMLYDTQIIMDKFLKNEKNSFVEP
ncbi:hypothetical protein WA026_010787 [Henosepilachna vigintioctopunctata]|uniref:Uncharacterized protein n=1 Tax=Henosepilachna vigintioctopunctata TaxID=420089 RepID=A0AAW1UR46_9CUCU